LRNNKWPDRVNVFEWYFKGDSNSSIRKAAAQTPTPAPACFNDRTPTMTVPDGSQRGISNRFNVLPMFDSVSAQSAVPVAAVTEAAGPLPLGAAACEPSVDIGGTQSCQLKWTHLTQFK
jgi:hypothetical protein